MTRAPLPPGAVEQAKWDELRRIEAEMDALTRETEAPRTGRREWKPGEFAAGLKRYRELGQRLLLLADERGSA